MDQQARDDLDRANPIETPPKPTGEKTYRHRDLVYIWERLAKLEGFSFTPERWKEVIAQVQELFEQSAALRLDIDAETGRHETARLQRDELNVRVCKLEAKVEQIDTVLDNGDLGAVGILVERRLETFCEQQALKTQPIVEPGAHQPHRVSPDGVVHNFGDRGVGLNALHDSRGLTVYVRGGWMLIPWETIDKKRAERDKAAAQPWWKP